LGLLVVLPIRFFIWPGFLVRMLVLREVSITPDLDPDLMRDGQSPVQVAAAVLARLEPILATERPDWVLVQGDTTTTLAAALAAFHARVPVAHVEAGLRTYANARPFPEELNRRVVSLAATLHFAPTALARDNLLAEGVPPEEALLTGNPVVDALHAVARLPVGAGIGPLAGPPADKRILMVTAHRRESAMENPKKCTFIGHGRTGTTPPAVVPSRRRRPHGRRVREPSAYQVVCCSRRCRSRRPGCV
jgi:UDP-N-acetylglucosamine 2-epimerase